MPDRHPIDQSFEHRYSRSERLTIAAFVLFATAALVPFSPATSDSFGTAKPVKTCDAEATRGMEGRCAQTSQVSDSASFAILRIAAMFRP